MCVSHTETREIFYVQRRRNVCDGIMQNLRNKKKKKQSGSIAMDNKSIRIESVFRMFASTSKFFSSSRCFASNRWTKNIWVYYEVTSSIKWMSLCNFIEIIKFIYKMTSSTIRNGTAFGAHAHTHLHSIREQQAKYITIWRWRWWNRMITILNHREMRISIVVGCADLTAIVKCHFWNWMRDRHTSRAVKMHLFKNRQNVWHRLKTARRHNFFHRMSLRCDDLIHDI